MWRKIVIEVATVVYSISLVWRKGLQQINLQCRSQQFEMSVGDDGARHRSQLHNHDCRACMYHLTHSIGQPHKQWWHGVQWRREALCLLGRVSPAAEFGSNAPPTA